MSEKFPEPNSLDSLEGVPRQDIPLEFEEGESEDIPIHGEGAKEAGKPLSPEEATSVIVRDFPQFKDAEVTLLGQGQNAVTFEVNGEYIFRFPFRLTASVESQADVQARILQSLEGKIDVEIPRIEYQGEDPVYSGYRKIEGEVFNKDSLAHLQEAEKIQVGKDMAHFLHQMHTVSLADAETAGYTRKPFMTEVKRKETAEFIHSEFSDEKTRAFLLQMLKQSEEFEATPQKEVALHGDLDLGNMFLDPKTKRLKGVIDFGDAIGDIHRDFFYAPIRDKVMGKAMVEEYERLSGETLSREALQAYIVSRELRFLMRYHKKGDAGLTEEWRKKLVSRAEGTLAF